MTSKDERVSRAERRRQSSTGRASLAAAELALTMRSMLRGARDGAGVSNRQIARQLGLTDGRVSQVLNGDGNVRIATLARFLDACGYRLEIHAVPVDELSSLPPITGALNRDDHRYEVVPIAKKVAYVKFAGNRVPSALYGSGARVAGAPKVSGPLHIDEISYEVIDPPKGSSGLKRSGRLVKDSLVAKGKTKPLQRRVFYNLGHKGDNFDYGKPLIDDPVIEPRVIDVSVDGWTSLASEAAQAEEGREVPQ